MVKHNLSGQDRMPKALDAFNDVVFKKLFRNEHNKELLLIFLNQLLDGERVIKDVTFCNSEMISPERLDGRTCLFDLLCVDESGENYLIEVQLNSQSHILKRMFYYMCCLYIDSVKRGDRDFTRVKGVYAICITRFLINREDNFKVQYEFANISNTNDKLLNFKLMFLQLTKISSKFENCQTEIEKTLYILTNNTENMTKEEIDNLKSEHSRILELMRNVNLTEREIADYRTQEHNVLALIDSHQTARDDGWNLGIKEGREQGIEQGIEQGREQGIKQGVLNSAKAFKSLDVDIDVIIKATGLSREVIEQQ